MHTYFEPFLIFTFPFGRAQRLQALRENELKIPSEDKKKKSEMKTDAQIEKSNEEVLYRCLSFPYPISLYSSAFRFPFVSMSRLMGDAQRTPFQSSADKSILPRGRELQRTF